MILKQHLLGHTNARLGFIFSQQTIDVLELRNMSADIETVPELEANIKVTPELTGNICTKED